MTIKVRVIKLDEHQPGDQGFTVGKVYDAWGLTDGLAVDVIDDNGLESALFEGEWERADVE